MNDVFVEDFSGQESSMQQEFVSPESMSIIFIHGVPFFSCKKASGNVYFSSNGEEFLCYEDALASVSSKNSPDNASKESALEIIKASEIKVEDDLLDLISDFLKKYVYLEKDEEYYLIGIYVILTYIYDVFNRIPYLNLRGQKGSGKTTLMLLLKELVSKPQFFSNITSSTVFRVIDTQRPTLFLDEVEDLNKRPSSNSPMFQIINSGYQRDGKAARTIKNEVTEFSTYCPKVLAAINPLIATIEDRCLILHMKASADGEFIPFTINNENNSEVNEIKNQILRWLKLNANGIYKLASDPRNLRINPLIKNRDFDKWFPILVLATILSTRQRDYNEILSKYAMLEIIKKQDAEGNLPVNKCKSLLLEFVSIHRDNKAIVLRKDKQFYYVLAAEFFYDVNEKDNVNTYNSQGEVTKALKAAGIISSRQRFGKEKAEIIYKVPVEFIN